MSTFITPPFPTDIVTDAELNAAIATRLATIDPTGEGTLALTSVSPSTAKLTESVVGTELQLTLQPTGVYPGPLAQLYARSDMQSMALSDVTVGKGEISATVVPGNQATVQVDAGDGDIRIACFVGEGNSIEVIPSSTQGDFPTLDTSGAIFLRVRTDVADYLQHGGMIYTRTVAGKDQLVVKFPTGAVQVLAAQP